MSVSPCRRRHQVGKEYRVKKEENSGLSPTAFQQLEVRQKKKEGALRIERKKVGMNVAWM